MSGTPPRWRTKLKRQPRKPPSCSSRKAALGDAVVDIGDGAKGAAAHRDGIERDAVVGAVHAGIDDDGAADAELRVQRAEIFERRIGRRVGPLRRIRIFVAGAEDVAMRVAGQRRQAEFRRPRVGIGSGNRGMVGFDIIALTRSARASVSGAFLRLALAQPAAPAQRRRLQRGDGGANQLLDGVGRIAAVGLAARQPRHALRVTRE